MTYYVFAADTDASANEVNSNFNEIIYAVLYNRMENDIQPNVYKYFCTCTDTFEENLYTTVQSNANIVSDVFYEQAFSIYLGTCKLLCGLQVQNSAGRYATICVNNTTSKFESQTYKNYKSYCDVFQYCTFTSNHVCCVLCATPTYTIQLDSDTNTCSVLVSGSSGRGWQTLCRCATGLVFCDYDCIAVSLNNCARALGDSLYCVACTCYIVSFNNDTLNWGICAVNGSVNCQKTTEYYFKRVGSCFDFYCDYVCLCNVCITAEIPFNIYFMNCVYSSAGNIHCSRSHLVHTFIGYKIEATAIVTNIKEYATPKNKVQLLTVSTLPAGNCIRYNIKNQAGTVLLCNGCTDSVQQLTSGTSCCFYAEIYQCVSCNLCCPQCISQYALMFM